MNKIFQICFCQDFKKILKKKTKEKEEAVNGLRDLSAIVDFQLYWGKKRCDKHQFDLFDVFDKDEI